MKIACDGLNLTLDSIACKEMAGSDNPSQGVEPQLKA